MKQTKNSIGTNSSCSHFVQDLYTPPYCY